MSNTLANTYRCPDCGGYHQAPSPNLSDVSIFTDAELDDFIRNVYDGAYTNGAYDKNRVAKYAQNLRQAVEKGYGEVKTQVNFTAADKKMIKALNNNVFHFSAAKNRSEIVSLSEILYTKKGGIRSFASFQREAAKITGEFQGTWLRTEYDMAVNVATSAARWEEFDDEDILIYRTAGDGRVRPEHAALNGIAKRKKDSFWDIFYPPNGWKCRCHVDGSTRQRASSDNRIPPGAYDGIPEMFRNNFAKNGWIFPPDHPYYKTAEKGIKKE